MVKKKKKKLHKVEESSDFWKERLKKAEGTEGRKKKICCLVHFYDEMYIINALSQSQYEGVNMRQPPI